jgi:hypothetical protein
VNLRKKKKGTVVEPAICAICRGVIFWVSAYVAEGDNEGDPSRKASEMKPSVRLLEPPS